MLLDLLAPHGRFRRESSRDGGEYAGPCPLCGGRDRFRVWPERGRWWCRGCDRKGDAIQLLRDRDGLSFHEAKAALGDTPPLAPASRRPERPEPTRQWKGDALRAVEACELVLWSSEGERARAWLAARGLTESTLRRWRIGLCPGSEVHPDNGSRRGCAFGEVWVDRGITIPWFAGEEVWKIQVRRAVRPGERWKYSCVKGGGECLFGALGNQDAAFVVEGELDAMLLHQEVGECAGVVTLGSAAAPVNPEALWRLLPVGSLLVAYDADAEGQKGAERWAGLSSRVRRIRPPAGKDLTEAWLAGKDLRKWAFHQLHALFEEHAARVFQGSAVEDGVSLERAWRSMWAEVLRRAPGASAEEQAGVAVRVLAESFDNGDERAKALARGCWDRLHTLCGEASP